MYFVSFPICNAIADYISISVTRHFLIKIQESTSSLSIVMNVIFDILVAVLILVLLAIALSFTSVFAFSLLSIEFEWSSWIDRALWVGWSERFPLLGMLVTTLIPSFIHFCLCIFVICNRLTETYGSLSHKMMTYENNLNLIRKKEIAYIILRGEYWFIAGIILASVAFGMIFYIMRHTFYSIGLFLAELAKWSGGLVSF